MISFHVFDSRALLCVPVVRWQWFMAMSFFWCISCQCGEGHREDVDELSRCWLCVCVRVCLCVFFFKLKFSDSWSCCLEVKWKNNSKMCPIMAVRLDLLSAAYRTCMKTIFERVFFLHFVIFFNCSYFEDEPNRFALSSDAPYGISDWVRHVIWYVIFVTVWIILALWSDGIFGNLCHKYDILRNARFIADKTIFRREWNPSIARCTITPWAVSRWIRRTCETSW